MISDFSSTETRNLFKLYHLINTFNVINWRRWGWFDFYLLPQKKNNAHLAFQPRLQVHLSCLQPCAELKIFIDAWTGAGHPGSSVLRALAASVAELYRPRLVVRDTTSLLVRRLRCSERMGASNPALGVEQSLLFVVKRAARQLCHGCAFWQQYGHLAFLQTRLLLSLVPWAGTTVTTPSTTACCSRNVLWHMPQKITNGARSVREEMTRRIANI